jgi:tRNA (guanine37-N1)-methyltransferase
MRIEFITLFPELINSYFKEGILAQGIKKGLLQVNTTYLRDFGEGNYRQVDDRVFGGGAGMLLMFEPMAKAIEKVKSELTTAGLANQKVIATSAKGETFRQSHAKEFAQLDALIVLCGRYEGFDERIIEELVDQEVSIGNYVLTGGELAGLVMADATMRLIPGVLGNQESYEHDSFYSDDETIQFPQYTRPEIVNFEGRELPVPKVLLTGHHKDIENWRMEQSKKKTG